jgi:sulfatase maturation enzyme AslB (radical SAM superfamily)
MELIIKPTAVCNFKCTFCAASKLSINHTPDKVPEQLKELIRNTKPDSLIFTGGEPTMCSPKYYEEILSLSDANVSLTSNLKNFYLHPDEWTPIFRNPRVGIATSFQYGYGRLWDESTNYSEEMFLKVQDLFYERIGYHPSFITVIVEDNKDRYFDHIELAKRIGTMCRLNNAIKMGRQSTYFPRYEIFKMWIDIIERGYEQYEVNCSERKIGRCPMNTRGRCQSCIRAVYVKPNGELIYSNCEDKLNREDPDASIPLEDSPPIPEITRISPREIISLKCYSCDLFRICNGCETNRMHAREDQNYCKEMTKLKSKIIEHGWKL